MGFDFALRGIFGVWDTAYGLQCGVKLAAWFSGFLFGMQYKACVEVYCSVDSQRGILKNVSIQFVSTRNVIVFSFAKKFFFSFLRNFASIFFMNL